MRPLLMIHGLCCGGDVWNRFAGSLRANGWRAHAPTIRADARPKEFGKTPPPSLTLADYVADMADAARRLEAETGERPVIVGHSLGGLIAQKLAEQDLASALVLLAPAPGAGIRPKFSFSPLLIFANVLFLPQRLKIWRYGFEWGMLNRVPRERRRSIHETTRFCSGQAFRDLLYPDRDPTRTAHVDETRVKVPVLQIGGAMDRMVPIAVQREVSQRYSRKQNTYVELKDGAHWLMDEPCTERVLGITQDWLGTSASTGSKYQVK